MNMGQIMKMAIESRNKRKEELKNDLVSLYKSLYDLTEDYCGSKCRLPHSCCSKKYCELAKEWAKDKWGVELEKTGYKNDKGLLFITEKGCIVAPHLRPICTFHTCQIQAFGFLPDRKDDNEYWRLRNTIADVEFEWSEILREEKKSESAGN